MTETVAIGRQMAEQGGVVAGNVQALARVRLSQALAHAKLDLARARRAGLQDEVDILTAHVAQLEETWRMTDPERGAPRATQAGAQQAASTVAQPTGAAAAP